MTTLSERLRARAAAVGSILPTPLVWTADDQQMARVAAEELDRLAAELKTALRQVGDYARQAGEARGRLEGSEAAGLVDMWRDENARLTAENERLKAPKRDAMITRSEDDWQRLEDAIGTQAGWRVGRVLSEQDISDLQFIDECHWEDEEAATDAYHRGLEDGLRKRGGDALVDAEARASKQMAKAGAEYAMRVFAEHGRDALRAENERLREALKETLGMAELFVPAPLEAPGFRRARQALEQS